MSNFGIPLKNRKKGSIVGQSHLEMHRMHFVVFLQQKEHVECNFLFCLKTTLTNHPVTARVQGKDSDHGHRMVVRYPGDLGREFPIDSLQPPREPLLVGGLEHFSIY